MKTLTLLFLAVVLTAHAATQAEPDRKERAEAMRQARLHYAATPDYRPYSTELAEVKRQCVALLDQSKFPEAIAAADRGLKIDRYNIDLLIVQAAAYRSEGNTARADELRQQWMSLIDSILYFGDGKTFATAYRVISVDEEYAVLHVLHLTSTRQVLIGHAGSQFDVITVKDQDGAGFDLYFNIDLPKGWLDREFAPKHANRGGSAPDA